MLRRLDTRARDDRGAAAVEFALVVVPLILLVFGIIQFGIFFGQSLALNNAARQGARAGVVSAHQCSAVMAEVYQGSTGAIALKYPVTVTVQSPSGTTVCAGTISSSGSVSYSTGGAATVPCPSGSAGNDLAVRASATGQFFIPLWLTNTFTVTGNGVFKCELT